MAIILTVSICLNEPPISVGQYRSLYDGTRTMADDGAGAMENKGVGQSETCCRRCSPQNRTGNIATPTQSEQAEIIGITKGSEVVLPFCH